MSRRPDPVYRVVIAAFRVVFRLVGLRFTITGTEHIPRRGPAVLASNHLSYLDFTFVGLAATAQHRLVRFMAKESVFANSVSGPLMRAMRHIPVNRDGGPAGAAAYRIAARRLAEGELVGVFPEATISRSFTLKSFKLGAATLAVREQVPLLPVVVWGSQRTVTTDGHRTLRRGIAISIHIGEPITPARDADPREVDEELRRRMDLLLVQAWREYPQQPRDDADRWWVPARLGGTAPTIEQAAVVEQEWAARQRRKRAEREARAARRHHAA